MELKVKDILKITEGKLYCGDEFVNCFNFSIDTRNILKGDVFIGIRGEKIDGNTLYAEAFKNGAACCILERSSFKTIKDFQYLKPIILVKDSIECLGKIAKYIRSKSKANFIGITGSVGKTSNKDMIYEVLNTRFKTLKTNGNLNGKIGVPLTITRLENEKMAVLEMGVNEIGGMDYLVDIVRPKLCIITNIGTAHIGNFKTRQKILEEKLKITKKIEKDGILIINNDNDLLHDYYLKNNNMKIYTVGIKNKSDIMATDIKLNLDNSQFNINYNNKRYKVTLPVAGESFIYNYLIAFTVGLIYGVEENKIIDAISKYKPDKNRLEYLKLDRNITFINDSYNASFDSMKLSLEILGKYKNRKIAILGDMLELGDYSKVIHQKIGDIVSINNIDILITVGNEAKYIADTLKDGIETYSYTNLKMAENKILEILKENDTVLFKASHSMNFNYLINNILKNM